MAAARSSQPSYESEIARYDDFFKDPESFTYLGSDGISELPEDAELLLRGGTSINFIGRTGSLRLMSPKSFAFVNGVPAAEVLTAFEDSYGQILGDFMRPRTAITDISARYQGKVLNNTCRDLEKRNRNLLGAFMLSDVIGPTGDLQGFTGSYYVSNTLIRQSQIAASESGVIAEAQRHEKSLKGKVTRYRAPDASYFAQTIAKRMVGGLLESSEVVAGQLRQSLAVRQKAGGNSMSRRARKLPTPQRRRGNH